MISELIIGRTRVRRVAEGQTLTILHDGAMVHAVPHDTADYAAHAEQLGYGPDRARMSYEHELLHTLLADWLGMPESPVMRAVADDSWQTNAREELAAEEAAVLAVQRLCCVHGIDLTRLQAGAAGVVQPSPTDPGGPWADQENTGGCAATHI